MKRYGLIGFPVKHSYSAVMHNAAFKELGINARYELFEISPEKLKDELKRLVEEGVCGFNVTIPHKEAVIKLLGQIDQEAELIGAVNTIKVNRPAHVRKGTLNKGVTTQGFNTDGLGFITHLKDVVGFEPQGKGVSILGAGGAAKAVATQLAKFKAGSIRLFDVDGAKARALTLRLKANFPDCKIQLADSANTLLEDRTELLINATPVGMRKDDPLVVDTEQFHSKLVVYDLIYNPAETPLLQEAKRKGCAGVFNGLGMLLYQGLFAFKIWLDIEPPLEVMEEALREVLTS